MKPQGTPIHIMLVEDNPGDVRLTQEALRESKVLNHLTVASDGVDAMEKLHAMNTVSSSSLPDVILLDLNLPRKDGREVLKEIKEDPLLRRIPVVILTTSEAEQDVLRAYDLHANCYIVKPVDLEQFMKVIQTIEDFWLTVVKLPEHR